MPGYKFISINDPSGSSTTALGINDLGQIVGSYDDGSGPQGFLFNNSAFSTLNDPGAAFLAPQHYTVATGVNGSGQIVGYAGVPFHGFLDTNGTFSDFSAAGSLQTVATGINSAGQIVGYLQTLTVGALGGGNFLGFLYQNGNFSTIADPMAATTRGEGTHAQGINDLGQIVGYFDGSQALNGGVHGFLDSGGDVHHAR
jgi:uncharacterized membrane protein